MGEKASGLTSPVSQHPTPSSVPASNLGSRAELTQYKESHTTTNIKVFPGEKHQHCLVGFPSRQTSRTVSFIFSPLVHILEIDHWQYFFFFACDSMMIHFFAISYYFPCHLFSWSAAYLPPPIISWGLGFSLPGDILATKWYNYLMMLEISIVQMTLQALWKYDSLWQLI